VVALSLADTGAVVQLIGNSVEAIALVVAVGGPGRRRVPGLRRDELTALAGVSERSVKLIQVRR
jgi:hypothetical protein